jgi:hypothetical protein
MLAGLLVVLGLAAAGGSRLLHDAGVDRARAAAEDRAVEYADVVIAPLLDPTLVTRPITGSAQTQMLAAIGRSIRSDDVARVRLWSGGGLLLFSTDRQDPVGSRSSREIRAVARGSGTIVSRAELHDVGKAGEPLHVTLVPMRVDGDPAAAIAQVDQRLDDVDGSAREPSATVRVAGIASAAIGVLLFAGSVAVGRRGRGQVSGFPAHVRGQALEPDTAALQAKLEKSETAREALEEQLGQLRTQVAQGDHHSNERARALEEHLRETEERARALEVRLREADGRSAESDRVVKDALRRAEGAEASAEQVRQASAEALERAERAEARAAELTDRLAEATRQADMHAASEDLGATLEATRVELEGVRAHATELEEALGSARRRIVELESAPAEEIAPPPPSTAAVGSQDEPEFAEQLQVARARIAELEAEVALLRLGGEDEGPSLRYRLARSVETKKRPPVDPENMWS